MTGDVSLLSRQFLRALAVPFVLVTVTWVGCGDGTDGSGQTRAVTGFNGPVRSIVPAGEGGQEMFVAGDFTAFQGVMANRVILVRQDGTIAQTFGEGFNDSVFGLAPAQDGSGDVFAAGSFTQFQGQAVPPVVRLQRTGTLDPRFHAGVFDAPPRHVAVSTDGTGRLFVVGPFTRVGTLPVNQVVRLNVDGSVDPTFNTGTGFASQTGVPSITSISPGRGGQLLASGAFRGFGGLPAPGVVRINPDGTMDQSFAIGTGTGFGPGFGGINLIQSTPDGTGVFVGGQFTQWNGQPVSTGFIRLHESGELDRAFFPPSIHPSVITPVTFAGLTTPDLWVAGLSPIGGGVYDNQVLRIRPDGSAVPTFRGPRQINDQVLALSSAGDGVMAGGMFTNIGATGANHFVSLQADGSVSPGRVAPTGPVVERSIP
jgi:hypothetical protein